MGRRGRARSPCLLALAAVVAAACGSCASLPQPGSTRAPALDLPPAEVPPASALAIAQPAAPAVLEFTPGSDIDPIAPPIVPAPARHEISGAFDLSQLFTASPLRENANPVFPIDPCGDGFVPETSIGDGTIEPIASESPASWLGGVFRTIRASIGFIMMDSAPTPGPKSDDMRDRAMAVPSDDRSVSPDSAVFSGRKWGHGRDLTGRFMNAATMWFLE